MLLTPRNDWGERVAGAYRDGFREAGGEIIESATYDPEAADHSDTLEALFNLDASQRRYRALRDHLRRSLEFTPYRRQDMEAVFLAAFPRQARLLLPQIRFHHGLQVPVYATSDADPRPADASAHQDLEGLRLVTVPWLAPGDGQRTGGLA
ncbi:MAG: penicillin-binding protein activator [Arhodomonas sp.]|nr:penicillin-binding protein activator [Arhodomonas sp.]